MPNARPSTPDLKTHVEDVQSHYDLSNEFFSLFLDPTRTYSCAYYERDDMTLEEAQLAKIDLALDSLELRPGMKLLEIGCGWGATMMRAMEKYDVDVVGLTLSRNQQAHVEQLFATSDSPRSKRVLLQSWEQFHEPVDRIVSIEAFEHFGLERYDDFFKMAYAALPAGGTMLLQTSLLPSKQEWAERNLPVTMSLLRFIGFMMREIFPGGRLPAVSLSRSMRSRVVLRSTWCSRCGLTTHEHSTSGRQVCRPTRPTPLRSSPKRLRAVHEVPDGLRRPVPRRLHRRLQVHARKAVSLAGNGVCTTENHGPKLAEPSSTELLPRLGEKKTSQRPSSQTAGGICAPISPFV